MTKKPDDAWEGDSEQSWSINNSQKVVTREGKEVCIQYLKGQCNRGGRCKFAHESRDLVYPTKGKGKTASATEDVGGDADEKSSELSENLKTKGCNLRTKRNQQKTES